MRKERIAEALLALVTPRERAASTAGDLTEQAGVRGNVWFWSSVLRTMCAMMWHSFAEKPLKILWLGFCGSLLAMLAAGVAAVSAIVASSAILAREYPRVAPGGALDPALAGLFLWTFCGLFSGVFVLCMYPVGRWVARRAPGREMIAAVSLIFMQFATVGLLEKAFPVINPMQAQPPPPGNMLLVLGAVNFGGLLANLAGAIHVRRRVAR